MAEADGNRTRQRHGTPLTGFEERYQLRRLSSLCAQRCRPPRPSGPSDDRQPYRIAAGAGRGLVSVRAWRRAAGHADGQVVVPAGADRFLGPGCGEDPCERCILAVDQSRCLVGFADKGLRPGAEDLGPGPDCGGDPAGEPDPGPRLPAPAAGHSRAPARPLSHPASGGPRRCRCTPSRQPPQPPWRRWPPTWLARVRGAVAAGLSQRQAAARFEIPPSRVAAIIKDAADGGPADAQGAAA